jgi:uncharacterized membrane protein
MVFSGLGAVIVGLGIILLFAYNWQAIPRAAKLLIVFGSLAAAHATGLWLFIRRPRFRGLGEAICVLGTMLFGAGIWLVAQIYHIDEHYPNGLIVWAVGALAMAWAMPSIAQGAIAAGLMTVWCGMESFNFDASMHAAPVMIVVFVGLLAWRMKSRFLLAVTLPMVVLSMVFVMVGSAFHHGERVAFGMVFNIGVTLAAAGVLARRSRHFPESAPVFSFYGWLVSLIFLFVLTFPDAADHMLIRGWGQMESWLSGYWVGSLVLCVAGWGWLGYREIVRAEGHRVPLDHFLLPMAVVVTAVDLTLMERVDELLLAVPFNLVLLALIVAMMTRGCRHGLTVPTVIGSLLLVAYMFARYCDLFESLLIRGLVFIVVGAAIFAQGMLYNRTKRRKAATKEVTP